MARYRKIDTRIWNDAKFMDLSKDGKLAFIYLLTHPNLTALGAMRTSIPGLAAEIQWTLEDFTKAFREAFDKGMLKHDERASFLWVPNFLKYNGPESPNVVKAWAKSFDLLPECSMKTELHQAVKDYVEGLPKAFMEAYGEAFRKSMPNQEQEQEQERKNPAGKSAGLPFSESDKKPSQGKKKPPTFTTSDPAYELSAHLFNSILKNSPQSRMHSYQNGQKEAALQSWAVDIDLLLRKDQQNPEVIKEVILFSARDDFWSSNILSGRSLRKQWDKLVKQLSQQEAKASSGKTAKPGEYFLHGRRLPTA